jgi:hypothetical protein
MAVTAELGDAPLAPAGRADGVKQRHALHKPDMPRLTGSDGRNTGITGAAGPSLCLRLTGGRKDGPRYRRGQQGAGPGPLAPFVLLVVAESGSAGYTALTTAAVLRLMASLRRWMQAGGMSAQDLSRDRAREFVAARRSAGRPTGR